MSNIIFNRVWNMPNKNTFDIKPIKELIYKYYKDEYLSIDPFANKNRIAKFTNDLDPEMNCDYNMDAIDFLNMFEEKTVDFILYDPPFCYDKETEVFTLDGWKYFDDITYDDMVATLNTETNQLECYKPKEIIKQKYSGEMVLFESQGINLFVTPNHKIWAKRSFYGKYKFWDAKDVVGKKIWMQKACEYSGIEQEWFVLPSVELIKPNKYGVKFKPDKKIPMDTWLKFLGLYISEGCCKQFIKRKNEYLICITQKKEHNLKKIEKVLNELGYKWSRDGIHYKIYDKQLYVYLMQYGKSKDKFIDKEIKSLPKRQLLILLEYLMLGDGTNIKYDKFNHSANKMYHYTTNSYSTASKKLMNDVCEIAIKCGYGITVTEQKKINYSVNYRIHLLGAKHFRINGKNINLINNFNDYIYCLVVPNSTLLVKRKGRCVWSGNSPRQVSECYKKLGKTVNFETTQSSFWGNLKKEVARVIKPNGIVITFGWNSNGIGKTKGFEIVEILLVAHGGNHNDTICVVERKIN